METKRKRNWHGLRYHRLYAIWCDIKERCDNPNNKNYFDYGGRGININDQWKYDFKSFYDYVTKLPDYNKRGMTLDRKNNNEGYEPNNLRWVDRVIQRHNSRCCNSSGFVGIQLDDRWKTSRYQAKIKIDGKYISLGSRGTLIEAVKLRHQFIIENNLKGGHLVNMKKEQFQIASGHNPPKQEG